MGISTFEQYLESLRDGREVYYRGIKIADITQHPILKIGIKLMEHFFG